MTRNSPDSNLARGIENSCDHPVDEMLSMVMLASTTPDETPLTQTLTSSNPYSAYVRYGESKDDGGVKQYGRLHSIHAPIPDDANYAGSIYLLTEEQAKQHEVHKEGPWAMEDCIATQLQNECEESNRVLHPIYVESDDDVSLYAMREALKEFLMDWLDLRLDDISGYYSGGRSIHGHAPKFVVGSDSRKQLKQLAEAFNADSEITLDTSNYDAKPQFRLPGPNDDKDRPKIPISWMTSETAFRAEMAQAIQEGVDAPASFIDILADTFPPAIPLSRCISRELGGRENESSIYRGPLISGNRGLLLEPAELPLFKEKVQSDIWTLPTEREETPPEATVEWNRYNAPHFSPYANSGDGRRSIAVIRVEGSPFCHRGDPYKQILVPAKIHSAVGCDGVFDKWDWDAPVKLTPRDYRKWSFEEGDEVVIIGGNSGSSRLIELDGAYERNLVDGALRADCRGTGNDSEDGRKQALQQLEERGYNTGEAGKNGPYRSVSTSTASSTPDADSISVQPSRRPRSEAKQLQRRAEDGDIEHDLSDKERGRVACRLLVCKGWDGAWNWFKEQYNDSIGFEPSTTYDNFKRLIENDRFTGLHHIEVPPRDEFVEGE